MPPPPHPIESARISSHEIQISLPPCMFRAPFARKGLKKYDDLFCIAYKKCTKSTGKDKLSKNHASGSGSRLFKYHELIWI